LILILPIPDGAKKTASNLNPSSGVLVRKQAEASFGKLDPKGTKKELTESFFPDPIIKEYFEKGG